MSAICAIADTGGGSFGASYLFVAHPSLWIVLCCYVTLVNYWISLTVFLVCTIHTGQCRYLDEPAALSISTSAPLASTFAVRVNSIVCHGVLGRTAIGRVTSGVWRCNSSFNQVLYSSDRSAMLWHGLVSKCDSCDRNFVNCSLFMMWDMLLLSVRSFGPWRKQCTAWWSVRRHPITTDVTTLPEDGESTRFVMLPMVCVGSRTRCCKLVECRRS